MIYLGLSMMAICQDNGLAKQKINIDSMFRAKEKESIGLPFPQFNVMLNDVHVTKDSLKGKVVFINFWFEACPPCIAELPALNDLYKTFSPNEKMSFISFTFERPEKILLLKKKFGILYPVVSVNRQECYHLNQNNGFPTSIILDANGIIKYLFTGSTTDSRKAKRFIKDTVYKDLISELSKL